MYGDGRHGRGREKGELEEEPSSTEEQNRIGSLGKGPANERSIGISLGDSVTLSALALLQ